MAFEIRAATDDDWPAMFRVDGRAFGAEYSEAERSGVRSVAPPDRYRVAVDAGAIVGIAGSFPFEMTMPGGATVPTGGITWVSVDVVHRRRGLLGRLMEAVHADLADRGEPLAALTASEGGIYERFGYGVATQSRVTALDRHRAAFRDEFVPSDAAVRIVEPESGLDELMAIWERYRVARAGEVNRTEAWWRWLVAELGESAVYVTHRDGLAIWKTTQAWHDGHPAAELRLVNLVALTPDAHAALWHTVTSADLVGTIVSRRVPIDDPLPYLLKDPRALRTTNLNDDIWLHPLDIGACFGARTRYGTDDQFVVEVAGARWRLGAAGASRVRARADLVTDRAALGALLLGGVAPSQLAAGRRLTARSAEVLRRADATFLVHPAPHCQTGF